MKTPTTGGRRHQPSAPTVHAEMNVTPLIDILLVLLVIFMAALPLTQKGLDVELPGAVQPPDQPAPDSQIVVAIDAQNQIALNQRAVTIETLEERLRAVFERRSNKTLFIMGAPTLRYGAVVSVIDAAKGAGVSRVGIVTDGMRAEARRTGS